MTTDQIQKKVLLHASRRRVWQALSDSAEFGQWFGVKSDVPFAPGKTADAVLVGTTVDAEVAKGQKAMEGVRFVMIVERMEAEKLFSFRWHPHALDSGSDYSKEPTTLVVFELEYAAGGTQLTVTESGFDGIPASRRATAFQANEQGWAIEMTLIKKYLERAT
jgi:uncharacterized protein YndB with AHSA1/START domain